MSFDASFDRKRIFLIDLLPKVVKKMVFSTFVDSSKNFLSDRKKKLSGLRDAHWIAQRRSWEDLSFHFVVDRWSGQGTPWV